MSDVAISKALSAVEVTSRDILLSTDDAPLSPDEKVSILIFGFVPSVAFGKGLIDVFQTTYFLTKNDHTGKKVNPS